MKHIGFTLLEVMLVLAIAAAILLFSLSHYQSMSTDASVNVLRDNVNQLLLSMSSYYKANCASTAMKTDTSGNVLSIDISKDLITAGYLPSNWPAANPLTDQSGTAIAAYQAQFVSNLTQRSANACFTFWTPECANPQTIANTQVLVWLIQVAVKMDDPTKTALYAGMAGADCAVPASAVQSGQAIDCSGATATQLDYLVWQRLPSLAVPSTNSGLWLSTPATREFNLQYTNDPMYEMSNPDYAKTTYYLCGG